MSLTTTFMARCTRCKREFTATLPIPAPTVVKPKAGPAGATASTSCPHCGGEFRVRVG